MATPESTFRFTAAGGMIAGAVAGAVMSAWKVGTDGLTGRGLWAAPGPFGINLGAMVPIGVVLVHIVLGTIVGGFNTPP